jgi:hypothetical protein
MDNQGNSMCRLSKRVFASEEMAPASKRKIEEDHSNSHLHVVKRVDSGVRGDCDGLSNG